MGLSAALCTDRGNKQCSRRGLQRGRVCARRQQHVWQLAGVERAWGWRRGLQAKRRLRTDARHHSMAGG
jgi:hypothetical protein